MKDGLSGFTKRSESPYDPFGAAHSRPRFQRALGLCRGARLGWVRDPGDAIAVIGDGAMSAGMAYEAMNNAGHLGKRLIVILNDNEMSIAPPTGAMSSYLSRLYAEEPFQDFKAAAKGAVSLLPEAVPRRRKARQGHAQGHGRGRHACLKSWAFPISGPSTGMTWTSSAGLRTVKARATGRS